MSYGSAPFAGLPFAGVPSGGYRIVFDTRNCETNALLDGVTVSLFRTDTNQLESQGVSSVLGVVTFNVTDGTTQYWMSAYKTGSPDFAGTTRNDIVGVLV